MATSNAGVWDTSSPADSDNLSAGAAEIRFLRIAVENLLEKERTAISTNAGSTTTPHGGYMLQGSARVYYQDGAPTDTPAGDDLSSTVNSVDVSSGRLWIDTNDEYVIKVYDQGTTAWITVSAGDIKDGIIVNSMISASADIDGSKLANDSIPADKLETDSVNLGAMIATGIIGGEEGTKSHIEALSIGNGDIKDGVIAKDKLVTAVQNTLDNSMQITTGFYSGSDIAAKTLNIGFTPKALILYALNSSNNPYAGILYSLFDSGDATYHLIPSWDSSALSSGTQYHKDNATGGVTVSGTDITINPRNFARVNNDGETHFYMVIG